MKPFQKLEEVEDLVQIKHQCGNGNFNEVQNLYSKTNIDFSVLSFEGPSLEIQWQILLFQDQVH